jgi:hypothetical protein
MFFFSEKTLLILNRGSYRTVQKPIRNYKLVLLNPSNGDGNENVAPARRRTNSPKPWIGRHPSADGKSTPLGSVEPPPCTATAVDAVTMNSSFHLILHPDPPSQDLAGAESTARILRFAGARQAGAPPRSSTSAAAEEDAHLHQKQRRRPQLLLRAAG